MQMLPVEAEWEGEGEAEGEGEETPVASVELQIYHHLISIWRRAVLMTLLTTLKSSSRGGRADRRIDSGTDRQTNSGTGGIAVILLAALCIFPLHLQRFIICRLPFAACRLL